jgi:hypothetical protein
MKRKIDLSSKTKAELIALAQRKKIPIKSGMIKDELIKVIKKGLRKIETQKESKTAKRTSKKKSVKKTEAKTSRKMKSDTLKKSPAKKKTKNTTTKISATSKTKPARSPKLEIPEELPEHYGDHRLVVMPRDPNWAFAYWDLNPTKVRNLLKSAGLKADKARWVLRVYSAALHPVEEKGHYFDVDIFVHGGNYYLNLSKPGSRFIVEIGVMDTSGMFRPTAQSNPVILPMDHPSDTIAQEKTFSEGISSVSSFTQPPSPRSQ